jgi:hypothetical protein
MPAVLRHSANADGEHIANIAVNLGGWLDQPRLGA